MKTVGRNKFLSGLAVFAIDVAALGVILLAFALVNHAGDAISGYFRYSRVEPTAPSVTTAQQLATTPVATTASSAVETTAPEATVADPRTPWQIKYAEHFTTDIVQTRNSYSSPNISVTLETLRLNTSKGSSCYYVADIYVSGLDCFKTYVAHDDLWHYSTQRVVDMDKASGAVLSVSGDFYAIQNNSFTMRNGELYSNKDPNCDICVLYRDGTMETFACRQYDKDEILAKDPVQIWNFGPELLDSQGKAKTSFTTTGSLLDGHPRNAIGYFEPGHYCLISVDGRDNNHSRGMTMEELAKVFEELGCVRAYNLDGGASAVMVFDDEVYNRPVNERAITDAIIVVEPEEVS